MGIIVVDICPSDDCLSVNHLQDRVARRRKRCALRSYMTRMEGITLNRRNNGGSHYGTGSKHEHQLGGTARVQEHDCRDKHLLSRCVPRYTQDHMHLTILVQRECWSSTVAILQEHLPNSITQCQQGLSGPQVGYRHICQSTSRTTNRTFAISSQVALMLSTLHSVQASSQSPYVISLTSILVGIIANS